MNHDSCRGWMGPRFPVGKKFGTDWPQLDSWDANKQDIDQWSIGGSDHGCAVRNHRVRAWDSRPHHMGRAGELAAHRVELITTTRRSALPACRRRAADRRGADPVRPSPQRRRRAAVDGGRARKWPTRSTTRSRAAAQHADDPRGDLGRAAEKRLEGLFHPVSVGGEAPSPDYASASSPDQVGGGSRHRQCLTV
jgi:hypothetical protein